MDPNQVWFDYVRSHTRFHTTQDRVWLDGVDAKNRLIRQGGTPYVTAIAAPEFGDCDLWMSNGHHTVAAYLVLKLTPYVRCFHGRMAGGPSGERTKIRAMGMVT
jgi:hypothetical protein